MEVYFSAFGKVLECDTIKDEDGKNTGVGFVKYDSEEVASREMKKRHMFQGQELRLELAVTFEASPTFLDVVNGRISFHPKRAAPAQDRSNDRNSRTRGDDDRSRRRASPRRDGQSESRRPVSSNNLQPQPFNGGLLQNQMLMEQLMKQPMLQQQLLQQQLQQQALQQHALQQQLAAYRGIDSLGTGARPDLGRAFNPGGMGDLGLRLGHPGSTVGLGAVPAVGLIAPRPPMQPQPRPAPAPAPVAHVPFRPPSDVPPDVRSVFVSGFTWWTTDSDVHILVSDIIGSTPFSIIFDENKVNGKSQGGVFVDVPNDQIAILLIKALNTKTFNRRVLKAEMFVPPDDTPPARASELKQILSSKSDKKNKSEDSSRKRTHKPDEVIKSAEKEVKKSRHKRSKHTHAESEVHIEGPTEPVVKESRRHRTDKEPKEIKIKEERPEGRHRHRHRHQSQSPEVPTEDNSQKLRIRHRK